jgi:hypothetical protein
MYELALLHAAARSEKVYVRQDGTLRLYERDPNEEAAAFHTRILHGNGKAIAQDSLSEMADEATFAALYRGDLDLSPDTTRYVLFPDRLTSTLQASDLIS